MNQALFFSFSLLSLLSLYTEYWYGAVCWFSGGATEGVTKGVTEGAIGGASAGAGTSPGYRGGGPPSGKPKNKEYLQNGNVMYSLHCTLYNRLHSVHCTNVWF